MSDIEGTRRALVHRIVQGDGRAAPALRGQAFRDERDGLPDSLRVLIGKIVAQPAEVTDADFAAAHAAGFSEDALFEIVVCAAVGEATRQYDVAIAALDAAERG